MPAIDTSGAYNTLPATTLHHDTRRGGRTVHKRGNGGNWTAQICTLKLSVRNQASLTMPHRSRSPVLADSPITPAAFGVAPNSLFGALTANPDVRTANETLGSMKSQLDMLGVRALVESMTSSLVR